jgi:hypothetical protein
MGQEPNAVEQAISRALRDSLSALQRTNEDLNHAISDLVASCSSSRPANSLSHALRAQTAAASLSAALDVLARFIAITGQQAARAAVEEIAAPMVTIPPPAVVPVTPPPAPPTPTPMGIAPSVVEPVPEPPRFIPPPPEEPVAATPVIEMPPPPAPPPVIEMPATVEAIPDTVEMAAPPVEMPLPPPPPAVFDLNSLPSDQQELHRRANRAAKVSMQDIKLLKPKDVQLGRENRDLCTRLKDDIEKARKEYDRRFKSILDQPVDYFYQWMVDILADGNAEALGEYPYPSPVLRR